MTHLEEKTWLVCTRIIAPQDREISDCKARKIKPYPGVNSYTPLLAVIR